MLRMLSVEIGADRVALLALERGDGDAAPALRRSDERRI